MIITFKQMPTNININNISGATPFNVYLCDEFNITCIYIDTVPSSLLPYNFQVPSIMEGQVSFNIKVVDNNNCTSISNIIIGPQPTNPFIILVSVSGSSQFTVPTNPSYPYNYTVTTSEQTFNNVTGDILLTWSNPGDYTVEITGQFPAYLHDSSNELQEVQQWGDIVWSSFENAFSDSNVDVTATDVPNLTFVTNFNYAFSDCYDLENLNGSMGLWDVSNATSMSYMFYYADSFNQDIGNWNVSNVTDMSHMFELADDFNQDIGNWDVGNVTNMDSMLYANNFDNGGSPSINNWNVSSVMNMYSMFYGSYFNQPIGDWNVSSVTDMRGMFASSYFNQPLSGWNVSNVTNMTSMFQGSLFNQDINSWDVSNVTDMSYMFYTSYSYPIIVFNQDIGNWNISNVTDFNYFMDGKTSLTFSTTNLDAIYNGWSTKNPQTGLSIDFGSANYTTLGGQAGRDILTGTYGWTIIDGGGI